MSFTTPRTDSPEHWHSDWIQLLETAREFTLAAYRLTSRATLTADKHRDSQQLRKALRTLAANISDHKDKLAELSATGPKSPRVVTSEEPT